MHLKVMTFNIQHGVDHARRLREPGASDVDLIDLDRVAEAVRRFDPDILSLNEVRDASFEPGFSAQARFLSQMVHLPYYYFGEALAAGNHGPYGNALLSRYPFRTIEKIMIPDPVRSRPNGHYETRCLIRAEFDDPCPLRVMNTHFGLEPEEAQNAVRTVLEHTPPDQVPTVLMGDFNLQPEDPILAPLLDVYRDSGRLLPEGSLSYPSNAPEMKIDYILLAGKELPAARADGNFFEGVWHTIRAFIGSFRIHLLRNALWS